MRVSPMECARRAVRSGALAVAAPALVSVSAISLAAALVPAGVIAQTFQFDNVRVEGNRRVEDATVLSYARLPAGRAVSAADVNAALQGLVGSGLFRSVDVVPQGRTLVITVDEYPIINRISIEGNRRIPDEALAEIVGSQPRRVLDPGQAEADAAAIADAYRQGGRVSVSVEPRIIERDDNRVDLIFEVSETRVVEIERLSFVGNREFTDRRLRRVLETKQAGLLRTFIRRDSLVTERLDLDRQLLTDFYRSRGYVDFQILSVNSEITRERDAFLVTFNVREGQQFRIGDVGISSEVAGLDAARYADRVNVGRGVIYSPQTIDRVIAGIEDQARRDGYSFVRVDPRITRNNRDLTLDVDFTIVRGPRLFVERIDIEGNATTLDRVIRRQFDTVEGDPFNPREIREAAERLRALGYFTDVQVETREGSSSEQTIVDVDVIEQPTGSLSLGGSYAASAGFAFQVGFRETNFLGRGQSVDFQLSTGASNSNSNLTFYEPALLGRDLGFRFSVFYLSTDLLNSDYNTERVGASTGLDFPTGEYTRTSLRYSVIRTDIGTTASTSPTVFVEAQRGEEYASSVGYTLDYDTRGRGYDPDTGYYLTFGQDFAGLGGDAQYVRTTLAAGAERRLSRSDISLTAQMEAGYVHGLGDYSTRVTDRFFTSASEFRGFESRGIGPRQGDVEEGDPLGGNAYAIARLEASAPLPLPDEYGLTGAVFADVGSVWSLDSAVGQVSDDASLRAAAGVSLIVRSPLGPLRFDFATPLAQEEYDRTQGFNFSLATNF